MNALPLEIVFAILGHESLSRRNLKTLRLVCRHISDVATALLFRTVYLSRLKSDRNAFLNIALQPHLAILARELVFYELAHDKLGFAPLPTPVPPRNQDGLMQSCEEVKDIDAEGFVDDCAELVDELFWLPFDHTEQPESGFRELGGEGRLATNKSERAQMSAIEDFLPSFFLALDRMPGINTIVSQPMSPLRKIPLPPGTINYPLTASLFLQGELPVYEQLNEGLYRFLIPALLRKSQALTTSSKITRLRFQDEIMGRTSVYRFKPPFTQAFASLTHIELGITKAFRSKPFTMLYDCLRAAKDLTELRLCFKELHVESKDVPDDEALSPSIGTGFKASVAFDQLFDSPKCQWPKLTRLHLENVWFTKRQLVKLVRKLANSLEVLRFDNCPVTPDVVYGLAQIKGLKLKRLISVSDSTEGENIYTSEARLLDLVSGNDKCELSESGDTPSRSSGRAVMTAYVNNTGHLIFEPIGVDQEKLDNMIVICTHGIQYREKDYMTSTTCNTFGNRQRLISPYMTPEPSNLNEECQLALRDRIDRQQWSPFFPELGGEYDNEFVDNSDYKTDVDSDLSSWTSEEASHLERVQNAPRWDWAKSATDQLFYWRVDPGDGIRNGYPTELWHFIHRNRQHAIGVDPLEFWEDSWEGEAAGDIAVPTPFGIAFWHFVQGNHRDDSSEVVGESNQGDWPIPYERATWCSMEDAITALAWREMSRLYG